MEATKPQAQKTDKSQAILELYLPQIQKTIEQRQRTKRQNVSHVTNQIHHAVRDSKPLSRYLAGYDAMTIPLVEKLPDRLQDWIFSLHT